MPVSSDLRSALSAGLLGREGRAGSITLVATSRAGSIEGDGLGGDPGSYSGWIWFFCVDDGGADLAVSFECFGNIYVGRLDPAPGGSFDAGSGVWRVSGITKVTTSGTVADHWHIFANGYHWISYSDDNTTPMPQYLRLLILNPDFSTHIDQEVFGDDATHPGVLVRLSDIPSGVCYTNDHFLVEVKSAGGLAAVAIGIHHDDIASSGQQGHYVFIVREDGTLRRQEDFLDATYNHSNLSSADRVPAIWGGVRIEEYEIEYQVLAPAATVEAAGGIFILVTHKFQDIAYALWTKTRSGHLLAMATQVPFLNGWRLVTARDIDASVGGDAGDIVRWMLDESLSVPATYDDPELITSDAKNNRPHTMRFANLLLTCWDRFDSSTSVGLGCYLMVKEIY